MTSRPLLELVAHLHSLDIKIWAAGDQLRYSALPGRLTPALKSELIERKAEMLAFLRQARPLISPILPVSHDRDLPLSFAQQRLWFLEQLEPGAPAYNVPMALRLTGPLNVAALEQSLTEIARRHEVLRATFATVTGQPIQVIAPARPIKLPLLDLQHLPPAERETEARRLMAEKIRQPFDFTQGPLLRVSLLRLDELAHILLIVVHHIVFDGWSEGVLFRELSALYEAFATGQPCPLAELPVQYADFALWQRQWLQGEISNVQLAYWKEQLGRELSVLQLPTDCPRPAKQTFRGTTQSLLISPALANDLRALSQQEGVTLFMTLLAAFKTLLYRYTGQMAIRVGVPIAGRNQDEIQDLIGFFVNTLVLATDLSGDPTFRELIGRVREVALEAYAHQDVPFEQVVEMLHPARDLSYQPLFQVMFALQNASTEELHLRDMSIHRLEIESGVSLFDLSLDMYEEGQYLRGIFEYNTELFEAKTITRMMEHFQILLTGIAANPEQRLSALPLLSEAEQQQLLVDWNDTHSGERGAPRACIHHLFETQVQQTPTAPAVVFGDERLTYDELNQRANQLGHYLQACGLGPEKLVGICVERSLEMVVGLLGVLKAGGAYVPLDPLSPPERLASMVADAQMPVVLTQKRLAKALPAAHGVKIICLDADWPAISWHSSENPVSQVSANNLAYVIYTSGSTGQPKGVMVNHSSLVNAYWGWAEAYQLRAAVTCHLQMANFTFDVFAGDWARALCAGGKLVLCPPEILLVPSKLYELMRREQVDCAEFVPVVIRSLAQYLEQTQQSLDFMRVLVVGSDSWYMGEYQKLRQFCGKKTRLINSYGLTEATIDSSYFESDQSDLPADHLVPIGRPFAHTRCYVLDAHLQPVPVGVPGELHIGGAGLARGYLNRADLTAEKFIPGPFGAEQGERLYKTGDLACYRANGVIELLGRIDYQVKIRGLRIELGEIETLLGQHPAVQEVVVDVKPFPNSAEPADAQRLVAYIVAHEWQLPAASELRNFLKEKLPTYMLPSAFMLMKSLPLTSSGKIDRRALPMPDPAGLSSAKTYVAPRDVLERKLAQIWEELLGIHPLSVTDSFFDLGGYSLLAVRLMAQIQQHFKQDLPLTILFQASTVEQLANILRQPTERAPQSPLVAIQPAGSKRPFFCVHPVGGNVLCYTNLARHLTLDQPFYGLEAPGLNNDQLPYTRIEDMARHYLEAVQAVQPAGPYALGGWSMGGAVAFEMAQQLRQQGHQVAPLILLDSWAPISDPMAQPHNSAEEETRLLAEFFRDLQGNNTLAGADEAAVLPGNLWQLELDEQLNYLLEQAKLFEVLFPEGNLLKVHRLLQVFKANERALQNYVPRVYPGRIILFQANEDDPAAPPPPDATFGWGQFAAKPVKVHAVPGNHYTMLAEPQVQVLANKLRACFLNKIGG